MLAALPVTVAHLGTTQAAWIFFFSQYAPAPRLLAFSLAAHLVFAFTRARSACSGCRWPMAICCPSRHTETRDDDLIAERQISKFAGQPTSADAFTSTVEARINLRPLFSIIAAPSHLARILAAATYLERIDT